jgi:Protein of unknwon function (DUF3310)
MIAPTSVQIQSAIFTAQGVLDRAQKQPIGLSTHEALVMATVLLHFAFSQRRLGNDDPHDMPSEFIRGDVHYHSAYPGTTAPRPSNTITAKTPTTEVIMPKENTRQVGGSHYGLGAVQHWDIVARFKLDYFQGQITKYVMRWRDKNGIEDLEKAAHYLEKYIAVEKLVRSEQLSFRGLTPKDGETIVIHHDEGPVR